jgi:hypothetical protein
LRKKLTRTHAVQLTHGLGREIADRHKGSSLVRSSDASGSNTRFVLVAASVASVMKELQTS